MTIDSAKALVAKIASDPALAKEFSAAKTEQDFLNLTKKHGYNVTLPEFKPALEEAKKNKGAGKELSDDQLDQVAGGISIVGVDYAFTVVQVAK